MVTALRHHTVVKMPTGYTHTFFKASPQQEGLVAFAEKIAKRCGFPEDEVRLLVMNLEVRHFTQGNFTTCVLSNWKKQTTSIQGVIAAGSAKRTPVRFTRHNGLKVPIGDEDSWERGNMIALARALKVLFFRESMKPFGYVA